MGLVYFDTSINAFHEYLNVYVEGEKWRRELVREITKKISAIQNGKTFKIIKRYDYLRHTATN